MFPIPPGTHWSEVRAPAVRAVAVPTAGEVQDGALERTTRPALPAVSGTARTRRAGVAAAAKPAGPRLMGGLYAASVDREEGTRAAGQVAGGEGLS